MPKRAFWVGLLFVVSITLSCIGWTPSAAAFSEQQKLFLQAWRIVNQAYLDETFNDQNWWFVRQDFLKKQFSNREQTYEAIEGMLASLDDPFTRLLKPEQYRSLQVSTSGELSGVGLQININPETGNLEVVTPLPGSPAEEAGIEPRDRILAIDHTETQDLTLNEAATRMRGSIGSQVTLTIKSQGEDRSSAREVEIVRDRISLNPVYANLDQQSSNVPIGYIRLTQFSANATKEVSHAVARLEKQGAKGYLLDLRNNPGGLLQAGIEIARLWLDQGTIVYTVTRNGVEGSFDANGSALTKGSLVVLVNQGTASASEILAGALQDNARAQLVGEKTFGKGLIQSLFELPGDSGIAVTVAKYETPNHTDIHESGIIPNLAVPQDPISLDQIGTEADQQYQEAIKLLTADSVVASH
ncbi:MAG: carboxyl-terminal protease [Cyanobacteria bacterium QS_8_48_54]|nr:MAG: carboxyl-terminal protease [Cyanobacteria bacterium QS_8_48_54]